MPKEYTYDRWERCKSVDCIEGLSYDAAIEIARANSIVGRCTVSTPHVVEYNGKTIVGVKVLVFNGGKLTQEYIGDVE